MTDENRTRAARVLAASPHAMAAKDALQHITTRRERLLRQQSSAAAPLASPPDFGPVPLPIVDDPVAFAAEYWKSRTTPLPDPPKPKKRAGRSPKKADARPELHRFRVIDGGGDKPRKG